MFYLIIFFFGFWENSRVFLCVGSATSSDSGHSSCVQAEIHTSSEGASLYHVASSIIHNAPSPTLQQRRHSLLHGKLILNLIFV